MALVKVILMATVAFCWVTLMASHGMADEIVLPHGKPLFTKAGTPLCTSEQGLSELLEHTRAGNAESPVQYGCFNAPDGWSITVINTKGFVEVWAKAVWNRPDGKKSDFVWLPFWMLRY
jgi:hypothetical protein